MHGVDRFALVKRTTSRDIVWSMFAREGQVWFCTSEAMGLSCGSGSGCAAAVGIGALTSGLRLRHPAAHVEITVIVHSSTEASGGIMLFGGISDLKKSPSSRCLGPPTSVGGGGGRMC